MISEAPWENLGIYDLTIIKGPRGPHCGEGAVVFAPVAQAAHGWNSSHKWDDPSTNGRNRMKAGRPQSNLDQWGCHAGDLRAAARRWQW